MVSGVHRCQGHRAPIKPQASYHFDRAEGDDGVAASAVGPGVPAGVLPLLKHILLPLAVGLLVPHPSAEGGSHLLPRQDVPTTSGLLFSGLTVQDLRSTQHQDRAHLLQTRLLQVVAGGSQLMAATLEVFLLVDNQLRGGIVFYLFKHVNEGMHAGSCK